MTNQVKCPNCDKFIASTETTSVEKAGERHSALDSVIGITLVSATLYLVWKLYSGWKIRGFEWTNEYILIGLLTSIVVCLCLSLYTLINFLRNKQFDYRCSICGHEWKKETLITFDSLTNTASTKTVTGSSSQKSTPEITRHEFIRTVGIGVASLVLGRGTYSGVYCATPRGRLRHCWLQLPQADLQELEDLALDHTEALEELVSKGELDKVAAEQIGVAFGRSVGHKVRSQSLATCYMTGPPHYVANLRQLHRQAETLAEIAWTWPLAPETVAQAQASIEQDIAALHPTQETEKAARFLVDVLLER
ncbi:MAG: hypothetical protein GY832_27565 [Chloroflexi bacterium]|nr:hypothetical protein [Chloroflexota bacterium]